MKKRKICKVIYILSIACSILSCKKNATGGEFESAVLNERGMVKDPSMDSLLIANLPGINCITSKAIGKTLVLSGSFSPHDTSVILITPYLTLGNQYKSVAYTDLKNRHILVQPDQIRSFTRQYSLNPETSFQSVLLLVLLHEIGHFKLNKPGAFDEPLEVKSSLGEMTLDTKPEYLTSIKRIELAADSIAISLCSGSMNMKQLDCFSVASDVLVQIPGMSFTLFGIRLLNGFGQGRIGLDGTYQNYDQPLRDPSSTHPNLELRVAFMSYFINPTVENRRVVDELLYNREVAPIIRQETAPYIFQGQEKLLSQ